MTWWFKARQTHTVLVAALVAFTLLLALVHNVTVMLPSLTGGSAHVVLTLFVPVPLIAALAHCLDSRARDPETTGVRPIAVLDVALSLATVLASGVLSFCTALWVEDGQPLAAVRNTAFLVGLMLSARPLMGLSSSLVPVGWLLAVCLLGFRSTNDPAWWTVVPEPPGTPHAAVGAALALVIGLSIQLRTARTLKA
ncbi:hypothetical protein ACFV9W_35035 [Streptomyces sp. NPDC059897]|uniref:hypothetical protein n=1 Tax=Streptomyces sp. NPDC059897 TaxID=3346994 RepID=UPI0036486DA9